MSALALIARTRALATKRLDAFFPVPRRHVQPVGAGALTFFFVAGMAIVVPAAEAGLDRAWFEGLVDKYYSEKVRSIILPAAIRQANDAYAEKETERWKFIYSFFEGYRHALENTGSSWRIGDGTNPHQKGFDAGETLFNQTKDKGEVVLGLVDFGYEPITATGTYVQGFEDSDFRPEGKKGKWWVEFRCHVTEHFARAHSLDRNRMFDQKKEWQFRGFLAPDRGYGVGHFNQYDREFLVTEIIGFE